MQQAYRTSVGDHQGQRSLGKTRCTWEDNVTWILQE